MPQSRTEKPRKAYRFLCDAQQSGSVFTAEDVARATGWSVSSCRTYMSKRWHFLLKPAGKGKYYADGVTRLSEDAFLRLQAQRIDPDLIIEDKELSIIGGALSNVFGSSRLLAAPAIVAIGVRSSCEMELSSVV